MRTILTPLILSSLLLCLSACVAPSSDGGYRDPSYGGYNNGRYNNDYDRYDERRERREIERERDRLEDERRRLEQERRDQNRPVYRPSSPPPARAPERCPSGFSPSENKCSQEERRRGCKDMRLPGGLGCVKR